MFVLRFITEVVGIVHGVKGLYGENKWEIYFQSQGHWKMWAVIFHLIIVFMIYSCRVCFIVICCLSNQTLLGNRIIKPCAALFIAISLSLTLFLSLSLSPLSLSVASHRFTFRQGSKDSSI